MKGKTSIQFLEIGIGSGVLSIAFVKEASKIMKVQGFGIDIQKKAVELSYKNT
jgi:methylase of polypeptide subunit release factors